MNIISNPTGLMRGSNNTGLWIPPVVVPDFINYYPLLDNANDTTGNSNGVNNNGVVFDGTKATFDGVNDYISNLGVTMASGEASWNIWVSPIGLTGSAANQQMLLGRSGGTGYVNLNTLSRIRILTSNNIVRDFTVSLTNGVLQMITVTRDSSDDLRVYVNGVESSTGAINDGGLLSLDYLGTWLGLSIYYKGDANYLRNYDRALSPAEITTIFNSGT